MTREGRGTVAAVTSVAALREHLLQVKGKVLRWPTGSVDRASTLRLTGPGSIPVKGLGLGCRLNPWPQSGTCTAATSPRVSHITPKSLSPPL